MITRPTKGSADFTSLPSPAERTAALRGQPGRSVAGSDHVEALRPVEPATPLDQDSSKWQQELERQTLQQRQERPHEEARQALNALQSPLSSQALNNTSPRSESRQRNVQQELDRDDRNLPQTWSPGFSSRVFEESSQAYRRAGAEPALPRSQQNFFSFEA